MRIAHVISGQSENSGCTRSVDLENNHSCGLQRLSLFIISIYNWNNFQPCSFVHSYRFHINIEGRNYIAGEGEHCETFFSQTAPCIFVRRFALGARWNPPCLRATLIVTNDSDSGSGSLRAAISSASSGDTITFASSLSGDTIILASTLTIDRNLTIDGSSLTTPITISGNDAVLVMEVNSGKSLTLDALTIANANGDVYGGGITTMAS